MAAIAGLYARTRAGLAELGAVWLFYFRVLSIFPRTLLRPYLVVEQVYFLGSRSVSLVGLAGLFVGLVMALQLYATLGRFGATSTLGPIVAIAILRELGPVITGLLYAGRAGTSLSSEIGLMRATEQLSAMEMMAVNPLRRIVGPRFAGGVIAVPLLTMVFSAIGILGAYMIAVPMMGMDPGVFWGQIQSTVSFMHDFINGLIKCVVFGIAINLIAVHEGYTSIPTAEGVGRSTTRTVVISSLAILALDFLMTSFMYSGGM